MIFGVVADIHGNFEAMHAAMARHPDVPFWLCVGDLASRAGAYPEPSGIAFVAIPRQRGIVSHVT